MSIGSCVMDVKEIIGRQFEEFFHYQFPEMVDCTKELNVPDFYHPSGFWVETKVGYKGWGCRVKKYQIDASEEFSAPVVHALGMHNFYGAMSLPQQTEWGKRRYLEQKMDFTSISIVSGGLMKGIWNKEARLNGRCSIRYCMVKPSLLRNIFLDRSFSRNDVRIESSGEFYGFDRQDYSFMGEITEGKSPLSYCLMLHKEKDAVISDYFEERLF